MIHDLKTHPVPFEEALSGRKPYSVRRADRPYAVGDLVLKREWDPAAAGGKGAYTGRELPARAITCLTRGYGLLDGYVVLGLQHGLPTDLGRELGLAAEMKALRQGGERIGIFIEQLAQALEVRAEGMPFEAGYAEARILQAIAGLKRLAGPEALPRLRAALNLVQDAHATFLLGSGAGAKGKAAKAAVELTALIEGRG